MQRPDARWLLLAVALGGCPQERPDTEKKIPAQAFPAAVTIEPPTAVGDAGPAAASPRPSPPPRRP